MSTPEDPNRRRVRKRVAPRAPGTAPEESGHGAFTEGTPAENLPSPGAAQPARDFSTAQQAEHDRLATFKKSTEDEAFKPDEAELKRRSREKKKEIRKNPTAAPEWDQDEEELSALEAARLEEAEAEGQEKKEKSRRKRKEEPTGLEVFFGGASKLFYGIAGVFVLIVVALGTWGIIKLSKNINARSAPEPVVEAVPSPQGAADGMLVTAPGPATVDRVQEIVTGYLAAENWEEKAKFVRNPERVLPLMESWYAEMRNVTRNTSEELKLFGESRQLVNSQYKLDFVEALVNENFERRFFALITPIGTSDTKLDWEVTEGYQPIRLEDFKDVRPTEPTAMRFHINPASYYNFEFDNEEVYRCFRLTFPGKEFEVYGYVEKNTDLDDELLQALETANTNNMILKVAYRPNSSGVEQVLISELVHHNWFP